MKLLYGFIYANLTVVVVHMSYIVLILHRQSLWMKAFDRDDEKTMNRYSADRPCWIGFNKPYIATLCAIYGGWLLVGWWLGETIRFW